MNCTTLGSAMVDSGCLTFAFVSSAFARKARLERLEIGRKTIDTASGPGEITQAVRIDLDIDGLRESLWAYVLEGEQEYEMILGRPWLDRHQVLIDSNRKVLRLKPHGRNTELIIHSSEGRAITQELTEIPAAQYLAYARRAKKKNSKSAVVLFSASMRDIQKALEAQTMENTVMGQLPEFAQDLYKHFLRTEADKLAPHRPGIDHTIPLIQKDGKDPEVPWGPLYGMSREELLALRKELTSLLDRGFIRVSRSSAAAPVLFVKKPGGGLRFCVDYRGLNAISEKDRYPLPLITETLAQISKAKWFTKLDVVQAFHKIRIAPGEEWKTAFRTRFGLYEWLVCPFGLANAPSTFQRYINYVLREHIDADASAYVDDVLIYSEGSRQDHEEKVRTIIEKLGRAGLQLDIKKSEFCVKRTKYLGFIIEAEKGIAMDPEKVRAIREWEPPRTTKGVRSFLGFANFYREFIRNFSQLTAPLTKLTGKNAEFLWEKDQEDAFQELKDAFCSDPALAYFDPDLPTIVETDASGWASGGALLQRGPDGQLRVVSFFSAKHSPAECNYNVHDKELLAVIKCLTQWRKELRTVRTFTIYTDHKNLEYFSKARLLQERHVRWSNLLSQYNCTFEYRPGSLNGMADALSRQEKDIPENETDERVQSRFLQLLRPSQTPEEDENTTALMATRIPGGDRIPDYGSREPTQDLWDAAVREDELYQKALQAVEGGQRKFPPELNLKASVSECAVENGHLVFRGRKWVPSLENLKVRLISEAHDGLTTGHPGRENTSRILARSFFWPGMSSDVRQYIRNCDICGRIKPWRDLRQGLLKPLPVPDRIWKELSMDFITGLPPSEGCTALMVVTDRLSKDVVLIPLSSLDTELVARKFIERVVSYHWLPDYIVSDRGAQFTGDFWKRMCKMLGITRRLSTAFHPQTDGATERMNSTIETYLRAFVNWDQNNWAALCPAAQIAVKGRTAESTKVSPFFLQHGYEMDPVHLPEDLNDLHRSATRPELSAQRLVEKFQQTVEFVQAAMAEAQQEQERQANRRRTEAPQLRVGDRVWLQYGQQLSHGRPSKKLDWKNSKFRVVEVLEGGNVRLDTPPGIHPTFHQERLRLAGNDPMPGQRQSDWQPDSIEVDGQEEWLVDSILGEKGKGKSRKYLVQWMGYESPSWEPAKHLENNEALMKWEEATAAVRNNQGMLPRSFTLATPE